MRLTLRTMLAYLDDILDPSDAQELGHKIEESKFASDLVHRIRSSTRRLRLGAPKVDGKGMAADPNTVAEYLDNVMPPDRVPEFEKVCLESDVHLAEVASAHQILTLVLGEPAVFDGGIREVMYRIGAGGSAGAARRLSEDGNGAAAFDTAAAGPDEVHGDSLISPVLVQSARTSPVAAGPARPAFPFKSLAITLLLGFAVAAVALRAMGEFGPEHPVMRWLFGSRPVADATQSAAADSQAVSSARGAPALELERGAAEPAEPVPAARDSGVTDSAVSESRPAAESAAAAAPAVVSPAAGSERPAPVPDTPTGAPPSPAPTAATPTVEPDAATATAAPLPPLTPPLQAASDPFEKVGTAAPASDRTESTERRVDPPATAPINTGLFLSEEQVLARLDKNDGTWVALAVNSPLVAGDELLSLPTYRPQVLVSPSVKLTLSGEALLKMNVPDAANMPSVAIHSGRATLVPGGEMGAGIHLDAGGRAGWLNFADAESSAALEVRSYLPPGSNPLPGATQLAVQLWATSGSIEWRERDRDPVKILAGQGGWMLDESDLAVVNVPALPNWIDGKNLSDIDRRASLELRKFLVPGRPLSLSLMEQTSSRLVEVRSLARRALCSLDVVEPALEAMENEAYRSYWHAQLDALQASLAQGPESAGRLRAAISKLYNEQADTVYRLIVGFSPEGLAAGGAAELVEGLSSPALIVRVLAYENLRRITGKTFAFRPEFRPELEKARVVRWRKMLEDGQIVYATPPSPLSIPLGQAAARPPAAAK
jgi:hypothetical protein